MDPSGHAPFDDFLREFKGRIRRLEEDLHLPEDKQDESHSKASGLLKECQELLLQLTIEAKIAPKTTRTNCHDILEACQMQLDTYKTLYRKHELFGDRSALVQRNVDGTVASQNIRLEDALRSIRETEALAGEVGEELTRNRDTLRGAHRKVGELSGMMEQANGHLKSLLRKWF